MPKIVLFRDELEYDSEEQYGILLDDETILCLCCMGILELGDYKIIKEIELPFNLSDLLKKKLEHKEIK